MGELEGHRAANERDAFVLQDQEPNQPNSPERSMRMGQLLNSMEGGNEQDAIRAALEVLRRHGSRENSRRGLSRENSTRRSSERRRVRAVSVASSNNTAIDLDREEFFGR